MQVIVIGAGVIGIATAYHLARAGVEVTVLERGRQVAGETSFANGAILTPSMADPWNAPGVWRKLLSYLGREDSPLLLRPKALPSLLFWGIDFLRHSAPAAFERNLRRNALLANYSLEVMAELRRDLKLAYDEGRGTLKITRDPVMLEQVEGLTRIMGECGVAFERLDAPKLVALEPALKPLEGELAGGIHFPDDEFGDAHLFTRALAEGAAALGARILFDVEVREIIREGGRVTRVATSQGEFMADRFVVAAGSHSPALARRLGVRIPVKPVKGYSITVPCNGWNEGPRLPVVDDNYHAVVTPLGERLRVAGTAEFTGFDRRLTESRIDNLVNFLLALYPAFSNHLDWSQISPWAGFRPMSVDGVPLVGATDVENLFINTGHGHLGWTMAAGSGRLVADLVMGRKADIDAALYDPLRF